MLHDIKVWVKYYIYYLWCDSMVVLYFSREFETAVHFTDNKSVLRFGQVTMGHRKSQLAWNLVRLYETRETLSRFLDS